jgi:hypothetical protein
MFVNVTKPLSSMISPWQTWQMVGGQSEKQKYCELYNAQRHPNFTIETYALSCLASPPTPRKSNLLCIYVHPCHVVFMVFIDIQLKCEACGVIN